MKYYKYDFFFKHNYRRKLMVIITGNIDKNDFAIPHMLWRSIKQKYNVTSSWYFFFYILKRVSDPSANIKLTMRELIHINLANLNGLMCDTSDIGDVVYDLIHFV